MGNIIRKTFLIIVLMVLVVCYLNQRAEQKIKASIGISKFQEYNSNTTQQIRKYNEEKNRDAATTLLDCALLVYGASEYKDNYYFQSQAHAWEKGYAKAENIDHLKLISNLYAENGNMQRKQWLSLLVKKLENQGINQESYDLYRTSQVPDKKWEEIKQLIANNNLPAAIEQSKNQPFSTAKLGDYFAANNQRNEAIQFYRAAFALLANETHYNLRDNTLKTIIMGLIKMDQSSEAIMIYRKSDAFYCHMEMIDAFIEKKDYDSIFNMLPDNNGDSEFFTLTTLAKVHIKDKIKTLKDEHRQKIMNIVMQYTTPH